MYSQGAIIAGCYYLFVFICFNLHYNSIMIIEEEAGKQGRELRDIF